MQVADAALYVCLICMLYVAALYVCEGVVQFEERLWRTICRGCVNVCLVWHASHACLMCMRYSFLMCTRYACLMCMPYVYAVCMPSVYALFMPYVYASRMPYVYASCMPCVYALYVCVGVVQFVEGLWRILAGLLVPLELEAHDLSYI